MTYKGSMAVLKISMITPEEAGEYMVVSENRFGKVKCRGGLFARALEILGLKKEPAFYQFHSLVFPRSLSFCSRGSMAPVPVPVPPSSIPSHVSESFVAMRAPPRHCANWLIRRRKSSLAEPPE